MNCDNGLTSQMPCLGVPYAQNYGSQKKQMIYNHYQWISSEMIEQEIYYTEYEG